MNRTKKRAPDLLDIIRHLKKENSTLKKRLAKHQNAEIPVRAPAAVMPVFEEAQKVVQQYFNQMDMDPGRGTIEINGQRYILVRASAFSKDFLETILKLYEDKGRLKALDIGKNFLFDIAHVIGMNDARAFHQQMQLKDPVAKLSAGPIHFAYTGWAYVDISAESRLSPDENFFLKYSHPYSFEADSWIRADIKTETAICIMNAGYSSGWCEESFGLPLTAVEISCVARGDEACCFIMSPPEKIQEHLDRHNKSSRQKAVKHTIPTFFERKKIEEELERSRQLALESARAKTDFVANVSHELRTPLNAILGFSGLLEQTRLTPAQKDYVAAVRHSGENLLSIINDLLDLSKMDSGGFVIESRPFEPGKLIQSAIRMFGPAAEEKKLAFIKNIAIEPGLRLQGDGLRLSQILVNLIGNALKFTEKGSIAFCATIASTDRHSVWLHFEITDTGIGISASHLETIFERFTQIDGKLTRKQKGTGLGLAITRRLVELQGGEITVTSRRGKGTTFRCRIPYKIPTTTVRRPALKPSGGIRQLKGIRVLVAEDNPLNQKLLRIILKNQECRLKIARDGNEAIRLLSQQPFDIVLMDLQMPGMDGIQAIRHIREILGLEIPVIAMTASALAGEARKCKKAGMNDYISKPFEEALLLEKMQQLLPLSTPSPAKPTGRPQSLDLSLVIRQTKNNPRLIRDMVSTLNRQLPGYMRRVAAAMEEKNTVEIYKSIHQLRGTLALFGASGKLNQALLQLEKKALGSAKLTTLTALYEKILPELEAFQEDSRQLLASQ
ncbi:hypothetical protein GCM10027051_36230 [Niabella terrae]